MTRMHKILIIEDDKYISHFITLSLEKQGYEMQTAATGAEGLFAFQSGRPDIVILDLGLPDMDGMSVLKKIRAQSQLPVLIVSARGQEKTKIEALDLGANDYITKPFDMGELQARIRVAERSIQSDETLSEQKTFHCRGLDVDYEKRRVYAEGEEIHLTPTEYKTLCLLIANRGKVLTHNFIIEHVWGAGGSDSRSVRVFMANLRRKIEKDTTNPQYILTEVGVGYRFSDEQ